MLGPAAGRLPRAQTEAKARLQDDTSILGAAGDDERATIPESTNAKVVTRGSPAPGSRLRSGRDKKGSTMATRVSPVRTKVRPSSNTA